MAMQATHILFARDIKTYLTVQNPHAYFAGAVYPDSRYVTHIERSKTHIKRNPFDSSLTDFEKGWATHVLYDELSTPKRHHLLPEPVGDYHRKDPIHLYVTAMKFIEDEWAYRELQKDSSLLQNISFDQAPHEENPELLNKFSKFLFSLYKQHPTEKDYFAFGVALGTSPDRAHILIEHMKTIKKDQHLVSSITCIYKEVLKESISL